jgi:hypothetical protein
MICLCVGRVWEVHECMKRGYCFRSECNLIINGGMDAMKGIEHSVPVTTRGFI